MSDSIHEARRNERLGNSKLFIPSVCHMYMKNQRIEAFFDELREYGFRVREEDNTIFFERSGGETYFANLEHQCRSIGAPYPESVLDVYCPEHKCEDLYAIARKHGIQPYYSTFGGEPELGPDLIN